MAFEHVKDIEKIERFLTPFPVQNAFVLGYLDPAYQPECRWYARCKDGEIRTLLLVYEGLSRPILIFAGHEDSVASLLREFNDQLPKRAYVRTPRALAEAVQTAYAATGTVRDMQRMGLERSTFYARFGQQPERPSDVERLSHRDTGAIMKTYAAWPDHFFDPYQLSTGLYFGIRGHHDDIASIAGIHNVSEQYNVAAIGNLVTHPEYRGKGYAHKCTATLLGELFQRVGLVALDVEAGNVPAIHTYTKFGFQSRAEFLEGEMTLKG